MNAPSPMKETTCPLQRGRKSRLEKAASVLARGSTALTSTAAGYASVSASPRQGDDPSLIPDAESRRHLPKGADLVVASYPFLDVLWTMFIFFIWIIWFMLLFRIIADVFRRH